MKNGSVLIHSCFSVPNIMTIFRRDPPPPTRASTACGVGKNRDSRPVSRFIAYWQCCDRLGVMNTVPPDRGKFVRLIAGSSKRRSLLMARDDEEMFMTKSLSVTPKTTEQHLIARTGTSEAEVIVECTRVIVLLELTTDRHEARAAYRTTCVKCRSASRITVSC